MSDPFFTRTLAYLAGSASGYAQTFTAKSSVLDLGIGEARYPLPSELRDEIGAAVAGLDRLWYANPAGDADLRDLYLHHLYMLDASLGTDVDAAKVLVTGGGKEAAWLAVRYLLHSDGGGALVPTPGWQAYGLWLNAAGRPQVPYDPAALAADPTLLRDLIDGALVRPSLLILNYPHNPTGVSVDQGVMDAIVEAAAGLGLTIVSDEVYRAFAPGLTSAVHAPAYDMARHLVVDSCSKWLTVAGLRVGFLVAAPAIVDALTAFRSSYASCTSPVTQQIARTLLNSPTATQWLARTRTDVEMSRRAVARSLTDLGIPVMSEGGLYIWCQVPDPATITVSAEAGLARLSEGNGFGAPGHVRICPARSGLDPAAAAVAVASTLAGR